MSLFKTNVVEALDSPTSRNIETQMPHYKIYNPVMEPTTVRARERVCTYGVPIAIGQRKHEGRSRRALGCEGR